VTSGAKSTALRASPSPKQHTREALHENSSGDAFVASELGVEEDTELMSVGTVGDLLDELEQRGALIG
jgi:hypothetical protein